MVDYNGNLQPDRWSLNPEDFRIRMALEAERQRILKAQAYSIEKKLAYPKEQIPPIPELTEPLATETPTVTRTVTAEPSVTSTVTGCEVCGKAIEGKARYCSGACRMKASRRRASSV